MRFYVVCITFLLLVSVPLQAQETDVVLQEAELDSLAPVPDPLYREDQFYATITYNVLANSPKDYKQYSFSTGITTGFLRDMPVNKKRNHAIALGAGYSYTNIKHNLIVQNINGTNTYTIGGNFDKNKLVMHHLEVPLELRWRNSDSISHKFWRVYLGFKVSYLLYDKAQYEPDTGGTFKVRKDPNMNKWVYGTYISAGWNTWNFYAYYALTPIYKEAYTDKNRQLKASSLNLGLVFYIL
ncbi:porin family protein [Flavobacterium rhizosphaerae]|uniref:Porin family protein n=1 Tax=Flavobacterium rhizosphaerae TaxID=3163298 RepID=A0ABW8YW95_9FLAO